MAGRIFTALFLLGAAACAKPSPAPLPAAALPKLALISTDEPFAPQTLSYDADGDLVSAHAGEPELTVVSAAELASEGDQAVPEPDGGWGTPAVSVGRGGAVYLRVGSGDVFSLDLVEPRAALAFPASALPGLTAFAARRDADGILWAGADGAIHVLDGSGQEVRAVPARAGQAIAALASAPDGRIFAYGGSGGACGAVVSFDGLGTAHASVAVALGSEPCLLALTADSRYLLTAARQGSATQVELLRASDLGAASAARSIAGLAASKVVFADDVSRVALLGEGAGPGGVSVAVALLSDLSAGRARGDQGPFRTIAASAVPMASDGMFEGGRTLYLADPARRTIETVR